MTRNTKEFRVCVDYDQVNAANDVFEIVKSGNDGVCITSLSMDGTDILVGNDQPNFWIDGNDNGCTDDWISTPKLTIVNGETQLEGCSDYCIRVTSGLDQGLCNNPKWPNAWENWSTGNPFNPAYMPVFGFPFSQRMGFFERVANTLGTVLSVGSRDWY